MNETATKIKEILSKRIDLSNCTAETKIADLSIDSLDLVEAVMDIEDAFGGIEFTNEEIQSITVLQDFVNLVEKKIA